MPVPHDFYSPYSDEPRLHNRHHSRPYIEPDWQAHAAGHQLPVLSTIGRGPRGYGMHLANYSEDGNGYQFDIISDDPNAEPFTVGPIPTGEIEVATEGGKLVLITNEFYVDDSGQRKVKKVRTKVDLPQAEDGTRIFLVKDSDTPRYKTRDDLYQIPWTDLYYYNNQNTQRENAIPEPRVEDLVMFTVYSDEDTMQLEVAYGFFASLDGIDNVLVKAVEYLPTIKGDKGDKGDPGKTPKLRYCLYGLTHQPDPMHPLTSYSEELQYIGTLDYELSQQESNQEAWNVSVIEDDNPPSYFDFIGVQSSVLWIGADATIPWIHNLWGLTPISPFGPPGYIGTVYTPIRSFMLTSMGPAPHDWTINPAEWINIDIGIMGAWAILACIDHSDDDPEPN